MGGLAHTWIWLETQRSCSALGLQHGAEGCVLHGVNTLPSLQNVLISSEYTVEVPIQVELNYWIEACVSLFQSLRRSLQKQSGAGFNDEWNSGPDHLRLQVRTVLWQSPSTKSSNQKGIHSSKSGRFLRLGCLADIWISFLQTKLVMI